uniref:TF-B3 domain-containing protein n=1 Tax=Aegilops tauschii subsp. strangulata TaxID=200361 RepID=A0A453NA12_AEGTS
MSQSSSPPGKNGGDGYICNCGAMKMGGVGCHCGSYLLSKSKGNELNRPQREMVMYKISKIGRELPVFVQKMTKNDILSPNLYFCKAYVSRCLPRQQEGNQIIPLKVLLEGMQMDAKLVFTKYSHGTWPTIYRKDWKKLIEDAGMKAGDICLFQVVDRSSSGLTMMVHMIRKSEMLEGSTSVEASEPRAEETRLAQPGGDAGKPRAEETHSSPAGGYVGKPRAEPSGGSDSDSRPHLNVKRSLSPSPGESLQKEKKMQLGATTSTESSAKAPAEETHAPLSSPEGREEMARHVEAATGQTVTEDDCVTSQPHQDLPPPAGRNELRKGRGLRR